MKARRMQASAAIAVGAGIALLAVAGCAIGPDYREQPPPVPLAWRSCESATASATVAASVWWTAFADPTLDRLVTQARERNHEVRLATLRLREAMALRGMELARLGPQIDATGGVGRARTARTDQPGSGKTATTWRTGFDAGWEIDIFGVTRRGIEVADAEVEQYDLGIADVLVSVTAETVVAYLDLRAQDERLAALAQAQSALDALSDRARRRVAGGLAERSELAQAEADQAALRARVPQVRVARESALRRLGVLLGELPSPADSGVAHVLSTAPLREAGTVPDPTATLAPGLPSQLLQRRPDLRQAERAVAAATARIGVAKADYYPRFSLTGAFGWSNEDAGQLFSASSRGWSLGPSIRWPLFASGRIANQVKAADARLEQAGLRYEQAVLRAAGEVEDALVRTALARDRVLAANAALAARRQAATLTAERFVAGLVDISATLEQERLLAEARIQVVDARSEQGFALAALAKALGGGW